MTFITAIVGFLFAFVFDYEEVNEERDTRSVNELRQAIAVEEERQRSINEEIEELELTLEKLKQTEDVERTMREALENLEDNAGLTEVSGPGLRVDITPSFEEAYMGGGIRSIPAHLLRMLINELNAFQADAIVIEEQRLISLSAVREVEGATYVNGRRLSNLPITIRVLTEDPERMYHEIMSSQSEETFRFENLKISATQKEQLDIPSFNQTIIVEHMNPVEDTEGET